MASLTMPMDGHAAACLDQPELVRTLAGGERPGDRRADPVLGAIVDVAIAYRDNLGARVAEAFMRETGVPEAVARRVLDHCARQRTLVPRRRPRAAPDAC